MVKSPSVFALAVLAVLLALLTLGCNNGVPQAAEHLPPTPTPIGRWPLPSPLPTDATSPVGSGSATGVFRTPTPLAVALQPATPEGLSASLIVSGEPGATESGPVGPDGRMYVSWGVTNAGPDDATQPFSVDLLVDGVPVERWVAATGLAAGGVESVLDWEGLPLRVHLTPGDHELQLVVDSTGYVQPLHAPGNSVAVTFEWPEMSNGNDAPALAPGRLPNLAPYLPEGWQDAIRLREVPQSPAGAFDGAAPSMQVAYRNGGLSSIGHSFLVYVYLDGILVTKFNQNGLIADEAVVTPAWSELLDVAHVSPGRHTLTLELDPTGLVEEANETDNVVSLDFTWSGPAIATSPDQQTPGAGAASLTAYRPTGWYGPLVISSVLGETAQPGLAYMNAQTYVSWAMRNQGSQPLEGPYTVELLISGHLVRTWEREGLPAGALDVLVDEPVPAAFAPGVHRVDLRVRVADGTLIAVAQDHAHWHTGFVPPPDEEALNDDELRRRIAALENIRSSTAPLTHSAQMRHGLEDVVDMVYRALYDRSLAEEFLSIDILTEDEFGAWVNAECSDVAPNLSASVRDFYLERCVAAKGFIGYYSDWRGAPRIVVRGDKTPMAVLNVIAHELGHFRQAIANPSLNDQPNLDIVALREAQAYAHQVVFFRTLESLTGLDLLLYPRLTGYENFVQMRLGDLRSRADTSEHARGQLALWMAILSDPGLRPQRTVLLNNLATPAQTAREIFDYLVEISPGQARVYVPRVLRNISAYAGSIEALATARLVPSLPYWNEGAPGLREVGLLLP